MENNFKDKKVLIMGLGLHGGALAVTKWLLQKGALLTITDIKTVEQLKPTLDKLKKYKNIKFSLGGHNKDDFKNQDLLIKNPGVPKNSVYLQEAKKNNIPIVNEAVMFFGLFGGDVVGVTGTRGKSTTSTLIHKILKTEIKNNVVAGNIATNPMFKVLDKLDKKSTPVLELSSWHLDDLAVYKKSPHIGVVTNVMVDHLNSYKNFAEYKKAKSYMIRFQSAKDFAVLNFDNIHTKNFAKLTKAKVFYFSTKKKVKGVYLDKEIICFYDGKKKSEIMAREDIKIKGEHNLQNVLAAITVAKILGIKNKNILSAIKNFSGIDYRLEYKGKIGNLAVYNDSTSTTPDATISAINALEGDNILLIVGGEDKKLTYKQLAKLIKQKVCFVVLLEGSASKLLYKELKQIDFPAYRLVSRVDSLNKAWKSALKYAHKDGCSILFSPAAASFNMFTNEFDRARQFDDLFYGTKKKR